MEQPLTALVMLLLGLKVVQDSYQASEQNWDWELARNPLVQSQVQSQVQQVVQICAQWRLLVEMYQHHVKQELEVQVD